MEIFVFWKMKAPSWVQKGAGLVSAVGGFGRRGSCGC